MRATIRVFSDWELYPAGSLPPLLQHSPEFSSVSNIKHADCVLLPYTEVFEEYSDERLCLRWNLSRQQVQALRSAYARLKEEVHARDVTAIAATHSDFEWQNPIMNSITFQTSLRRSARRERDFALAGFPTSDLASGHGRSVERPSNWTDLPSASGAKASYSALNPWRLCGWKVWRATFMLPLARISEPRHGSVKPVVDHS